jgi:CRP/FNR family transcriptional regulator, cyclic AMP receptor protein
MAIKRRPAFNPKSFLAKVGEGRSIDTYRKDQIVFSQGDPADAVFYIQKGKVKVTVVSEQGKEAVVAILGTNDFLGEGCLAGQALRIATVTTMTDSAIVRLEKMAIVRVIHHRSRRALASSGRRAATSTWCLKHAQMRIADPLGQFAPVFL